MTFRSQREILALFFGDLVSFLTALWLALLVRNWALPGFPTFTDLLRPFFLIFIVWFVVFYIADLYGKQTSLFKAKLPKVIFNTQLINSAIAVLFFYFIPYFGVTPKTILFIDLIISFILVLGWRRWLFPKLYKARRETVVFLCRGREVEGLIQEIKSNPKYNARVITQADPTESNFERAGIFVINSYDRQTDQELSDYYRMIFAGAHFVNAHSLYENIFGRVPVGIINERWFLENIGNSGKTFYDLAKRLVDFVIALGAGLFSLVFYPFIWLAIKLDDHGPLFSVQERIGEKNRSIQVYKFRTRERAFDDGDYDSQTNEITRVGRFLRQTRLDELPQLWNVLRGDVSLIGPRPELPALVKAYELEIPYYAIRHLIKPGLSGWAQIYQEHHPHHKIALDDTRDKLSYDLYYVKNRGLWLDLAIILKTIKTLLSVAGK